ncbi:MAG: DNA gyrase subunit A [Gemmatimonadota bacterium]
MSAAARRERILPRLIEEEIRDSFLDYSMSVIVQRALPDVRDGLKPVHRRILYAMHELGLRPDRAHKKSATVVGEVLGKFHPHGDTAVYDALVRMVQDFSLRYPLIDGQGNFGSLDGDSAAAYRYTEARLDAVAVELLADIEKETVAFQPNYDDRLEEPSVLPGKIPNLLVNGSSGIAVGMSTNVPPHNLREIAKAVKLICGDEQPTVAQLMKLVPGPDFPTGGIIVGRNGIRDMYSTGRGRMIVRGRVVKEALRAGKEQLVITELPYGVSKSRLVEQIADVARQVLSDDIADLRDESDRDGVRVVVELKRKGDPGRVLKTLYRKTSLQSTFGAILLALDHGQPRELNLLEILERYRDHRLEVIRKRSTFLLEKAEAEKHITEGLLIALDQIDKVIKIIRSSADRPEASEKLQDALGLSEVQADAILDMRLARLTKLQKKELQDRLKELKAEIAHLRGILKSEARQVEVMLDELDEAVKRFGDDRRTVITDEAKEETAEEVVEDLVAEEDVVVTVSHEGYVKRIPMGLYQRRVRSGKALAGMEKYEDDFLERVFVARTSGLILAFTEAGQAHFLPVQDVPESARASRGQSIYGLLGVDRKERIVAAVPVEDLDADRHLVFVTRGGLIKRTHLSEFANPRAGGVIAMGVKKGDRVLDVGISDGGAEVMLLTANGRAIRFAEDDISVFGRTAQGVKGVSVGKDDGVVGMILVRREASILTVAADGMGKRSPLEEFPLQGRGGMGTLVGPSDSKVPLVAALEMLPDDEVMVVAASGKVFRLVGADVPEQGRRTRGSPLVQLGRGDRVVEVTRTESSGEGGGPVRPAAGGGREGQLDLLG